MKKIRLTKGQHTLVDDEDFERFGHLKWNAVFERSTKRFYAKRYARLPVGKTVALHRTILGVTDPKVKVDHRNHDGLDNRRENLRICTHAQNCQNKSGPYANSKSGMRGVFWIKSIKKWKAKITANGKIIHLGLFKEKALAAAAYAAANREHFGEFGGNL